MIKYVCLVITCLCFLKCWPSWLVCVITLVCVSRSCMDRRTACTSSLHLEHCTRKRCKMHKKMTLDVGTHLVVISADIVHQNNSKFILYKRCVMFLTLLLSCLPRHEWARYAFWIKRYLYTTPESKVKLNVNFHLTMQKVKWLHVKVNFTTCAKEPLMPVCHSGELLVLEVMGKCHFPFLMFLFSLSCLVWLLKMCAW